MDPLLGRIETLEQQVLNLTQQASSVTRSLRWWRRLACGLMALMVLCLVVIADLAGGNFLLSAHRLSLSAPTLAELCTRHRTDKCPSHHNYVAFYEALFSPLRNQKLRRLEIGVLDGHSLRLWEAYFPSAQIFGLDIKRTSQHDSQRIKTFVADQSKREDLVQVLATTGSGFDIILDDGGHRMNQQQISFATLFPALKSGALYILEDVHTSFPHFYPGYGVDQDGGNSTYAMIDHFVRTGKIRNTYLTDVENDFLSDHISHCMYFWRSSRRHSDFLACWKK